MYAILQTGGKQYVASPGETIRVEKLAGEPGDAVEFDQIVTVSQDDGEVLTGSDVEGAKVTGVIGERTAAQQRHSQRRSPCGHALLEHAGRRRRSERAAPEHR